MGAKGGSAMEMEQLGQTGGEAATGAGQAGKVMEQTRGQTEGLMGAETRWGRGQMGPDQGRNEEAQGE